ncbi:MAG: RHS repeat-associated core domain-containing protein, partial [Planctomycetota bacterium]
EYDAYGDCHVLEPNYADDLDGKSDYANPYLFTGRRVDILDEGSLKIQYNRNRYYDYYTGRWTTHDPLGINPGGGHLNPFSIGAQYDEAVNLYSYVRKNPLRSCDPYGLAIACCDPDCKGYRHKRRECYRTVAKWNFGCMIRGALVCGVACSVDVKHPACLACLLLYHAACKAQYVCTLAYCNAMRAYCEGKRSKKPGFWTRMKCGGYFQDPWPEER